MVADSVVCLLGIGLTVPQIIAQSSIHPPVTFDFSIQFIPQTILICALIFKSFNKTTIPCIVSASFALLGMYFLLIFNSQNSSLAICSNFPSICAELNDIVYVSRLLAPWEAFMYLIGVPISIMGATLLLKSAASSYKSAEVSTAPKA